MLQFADIKQQNLANLLIVMLLPDLHLPQLIHPGIHKQSVQRTHSPGKLNQSITCAQVSPSGAGCESVQNCLDTHTA